MMRKTAAVCGALLLPALVAGAQGTVTLDSCRHMALRSSKALRMASEAVQGARYTKKAAAAAYLPAIDAGATYMLNQHRTSILSEDAKLPTMSFDPATGKYNLNLVTGPDGVPVKDPKTGQYIPSEIALIPKEAMQFDTRQIFAGAVTLTQPVFMGGEIKALNDIARYAAEGLEEQRSALEQDVVYAVDESYWTVVSLEAKKRLAESFMGLVDTLRYNVDQMLREGVATRADLLTVDVKLNEAKLMLTKVDNGLSLSRMALAQACGLPVDSDLRPADASLEATPEAPAPVDTDIEAVWARRHDLGAVRKAIGAAKGAEKLALGAMLPKLGIVGAWGFSTPNFTGGYNRGVKGNFSIGAALTVPVWHWGGNYNKLRAARSATNAQRLLLEDLEEKVQLQVNQAKFKYGEAFKTLSTAQSNISSAEENLRCARDGFAEGVLTANDVIAAQTGWLQAESELIDARIGVQLCDTYLSKVLGTLEDGRR